MYDSRAPTGRSIREWQDMFECIYGERNRWYNTRERVVMRMGHELCLINVSVNKDRPDNLKVLAGFGARIFALANLLGVDMNELVFRKYPGVCVRCTHKPCKCLELDRLPQKHMGSSSDVIDLGIDEIYALLQELYGERNHEAGRLRVFLRLNEEFLELMQAVYKRDIPLFQEELADVFAWWMGYCHLARTPNNRQIASISSLLYAVYPDACSRCRRNPCPVNGPNACPPL